MACRHREVHLADDMQLVPSWNAALSQCQSVVSTLQDGRQPPVTVSMLIIFKLLVPHHDLLHLNFFSSWKLNSCIIHTIACTSLHVYSLQFPFHSLLSQVNDSFSVSLLGEQTLGGKNSESDSINTHTHTPTHTHTCRDSSVVQT